MIDRLHTLFRPGGIGLLLALLAVGCSRAEESDNKDRSETGTPIAAVEIQPRDLSRQLRTSGVIQPRVTIRLASRATGLLQQVHVEEGDAVEEGDLLAELDMSEAIAERNRAKARADQAYQDYLRLKLLQERDLVSQAEYELARTAHDVAASEQKLWQTRVDFGQIRAPRKAVVTARLVEPGEAIEAQDAVFELAALDELVVRLGISELDIVHLKQGDTVEMRLDALPDTPIQGEIRRIFPSADAQSRLITVEIQLPHDATERGVRPGFLARVRMEIDARPNALAVPASAIGEDGDDRYVYAVVDDRLEQRIVETGVTRSEWTEIRSGLEEGDIVLATNPIDMSPGMLVRIVGWRG